MKEEGWKGRSFTYEINDIFDIRKNQIEEFCKLLESSPSLPPNNSYWYLEIDESERSKIQILISPDSSTWFWNNYRFEKKGWYPKDVNPILRDSFFYKYTTSFPDKDIEQGRILRTNNKEYLLFYTDYRNTQVLFYIKDKKCFQKEIYADKFTKYDKSLKDFILEYESDSSVRRTKIGIDTFLSTDSLLVESFLLSIDTNYLFWDQSLSKPFEIGYDINYYFKMNTQDSSETIKGEENTLILKTLLREFFLHRIKQKKTCLIRKIQIFGDVIVFSFKDPSEGSLHYLFDEKIISTQPLLLYGDLKYIIDAKIYKNIAKETRTGEKKYKKGIWNINMNPGGDVFIYRDGENPINVGKINDF